MKWASGAGSAAFALQPGQCLAQPSLVLGLGELPLPLLDDALPLGAAEKLLQSLGNGGHGGALFRHVRPAVAPMRCKRPGL